MSSMPTDLDGFLPFLSTTDTKMKLSIGAKLYTYLGNPSNSIECSDIGQFVDTLVLWLQSSNFKVVQVGLEILTELVEKMKTDFQTYLPSVLPCLIDKLGDGKETIREKTLFLLMKLMECEAITAQNLFDRIANAAFSHKNSNVREHIMNFLVSTLDEHGASSLCVSKLVPHIVKLLSDPNASVRSAAFNTLVNIYKHVGDRLRADLQKKYSIPQNKLPALMNSFDEIKASGDLLPSALALLSIKENNGGEDETDRSDKYRFAAKRTTVNTLSATRRPPSTPLTTSTNSPAMVSKLTKSSSGRKNNAGNGHTGGVDEDTFNASFEDVPIVQIYHAKDIEDLMKKAQEIIDNVNQDWSKRVEYLKKLRSLVVSGGLDYDDFYTNLNILLPAFHTSIKDLRSQVVREACITIAYLSKRLGMKFDHFAESLLSSLINLIQNSAKVIASSGLISVRFILQYTHAPRLVPVIASSLGSKSKDIRRACCEFIYLILKSWSAHSLEKYVPILQEAVKKGIADADPDARVHSRKSYWAFSEHFPDQAETLLASLDYSYRKLLACNSNSSSSTSLSKPLSVVENFKAPTHRLSIATTSVSLRSNSAIDLQAAKRAKVRAQYAALARQKVGAGTASLPRSKKIPSPSKDQQALERASRTRSRVSVSQPTSRSGSPSSRLSYGVYMPSGVAGSGVRPRRSSTGLTSRSTDTSREPSPNRFVSGISSYRGRPPIQPTCKPVMAQKILQQSQEAESALADALGNSWDNVPNVRMSSRKVFRSLDDHSDESETSSMCSEHSFDSYRRPSDSYSWNGSQHRLHRDAWEREPTLRDIGEIISNCESTHWNDRKEGLINLQYYIQNGNRIPLAELKRIMDIFTKIFNDPHIKAFSLFLDSLNELIISHHDDLHFCLHLLLTRLLNKLGTDLLSSVHSKIMKTLDVVCTSFPPDLQLQSVFRFLVDPTQTPNTRVKIATLNFIIKLTTAVNPCLAFVSNNIDKNKDHATVALGKMISWTMGDNIKQGPELRKIAQDCILALFNLNTPQVTLRFSLLSKEYQEAAATLIKNNYRNETSTSFKSDYKSSDSSNQQYSGNGTDTMDSHFSNLNSEDIYKSFRKTTAEIQKYNDNLSSSGDKETTSLDSGICQMSSVEREEVRNGTCPCDSMDSPLGDDMLRKYIDNLSRDTDCSLEGRKDLLLQIEQILQEGPSDTIITNFKALLRLVLSLIEPSEPSIIKQMALSLLQTMVKRKTIKFCFKDYIELIVLKVMNVSRDSCKEVVKSAENCAIVLSTHLPGEFIIRVIVPLITAEDYPVNLLSIKMLTRLVEYSGQSVVIDNIAQIMSGLLTAYDNFDSSVRKSAVFCMVSLHKELGEDVLASYINTLSGAKLKLLELYIKRAQQGSSMPTSPKNN